MVEHLLLALMAILAGVGSIFSYLIFLLGRCCFRYESTLKDIPAVGRWGEDLASLLNNPTNLWFNIRRHVLQELNHLLVSWTGSEEEFDLSSRGKLLVKLVRRHGLCGLKVFFKLSAVMRAINKGKISELSELEDRVREVHYLMHSLVKQVGGRT